MQLLLRQQSDSISRNSMTPRPSRRGSSSSMPLTSATASTTLLIACVVIASQLHSTLGFLPGHRHRRTTATTWMADAPSEIPLVVPTADVVTRVAVPGATGKTGRLVVQELLARGVSSVVGLVRDMDKARTVFGEDRSDRLELVECNLGDALDVTSAVAGCDAAVWCATGFSDAPAGSDPGTPGPSIDLVGLPALARSLYQGSPTTTTTDSMPKLVMCSSAGVTRLLWDEAKQKKYVGAADIPIVRLNPFGILDRKRESEDLVRATCGGGPHNGGQGRRSVDYCIVRPCGLNDEWPAGSRPVLSQGDVAAGRLNRQDLATLLVDVLSTPSATQKTFEVVGVAGYPAPRSLEPALERLKTDQDMASLSDAELQATYAIMQQLLPGEKQESASLAMGQTYEQLDEGTTGRLGERGKENAEAVAPKPSS